MFEHLECIYEHIFTTGRLRGDKSPCRTLHFCSCLSRSLLFPLSYLSCLPPLKYSMFGVQHRDQVRRHTGQTVGSRAGKRPYRGKDASCLGPPWHRSNRSVDRSVQAASLSSKPSRWGQLARRRDRRGERLVARRQGSFGRIG